MWILYVEEDLEMDFQEPGGRVPNPLLACAHVNVHSCACPGLCLPEYVCGPLGLQCSFEGICA